MTEVALLLFVAAGAAAQSPEVSIRTSVREVVVEVVVHDRHGKLVRNLDAKDVALYEDGVRQEIRSLRLVGGGEVRQQDAEPSRDRKAAVSSPLRTLDLICLVFHDLSLENRKTAFEAAIQFLNSELRPNTIIGVFSLDDRGVHPLSPFTRDRAALVKAIQMAAAGQIPTLGTAQQLFTAIGLQWQLTISPPPLPSQAPAQASSASSFDFSRAAVGMDASMAVGDAADISRNPLGRRAIDYQRVVGIRELRALGWLLSQLRQLPFRKTVLLFSPGIYRPETEVDYWRDLLKTANAANVSFYVLETTGSSTASPLAASKAAADRTVGLSRAQGQPLPPVNGLGAEMDRAHQSDIADYAVAAANTHNPLVDLAEGTGGFLITDSGKRMLARVMDDVQTHFELTYRPAAANDDGRFHRIEVRLAREDLRVEARSGYFAVPETAGGIPPEEMAGLRALNTKPLPRDIDFRSQALRFRAPDGQPEFAIVFDIPIANLAATADAAGQKHRMHASLLALITDSQGRIVEQLSSDAPMEMTQAEFSSPRTGRLEFARPVKLGPGHYSVETAIVDWEAGRSSTNVFQIDSTSQKGPELSSLVLVRRLDDGSGAPAGSDPLAYQGKRIVPSLFTDLEPGVKPYIFFRVYPDKASSAPLRLRAHVLREGHLVSEQISALPAADASGSIPVVIEAATRPGSHELRLTVSQGEGASSQGEGTSTQDVRYTVPAQ